MHKVPFLMACCTMCIVTEIILGGYMEKGVLWGESFHVCSVYFSIFLRNISIVPSLSHYSPWSKCFSLNTRYLMNTADVTILIYFYPFQIHQNENCDQHLYLQPCFSRCLGNKHSAVPEHQLPDGYMAFWRCAVQDCDVHWLLQHVHQYLYPHDYECWPLHCCLPPG